MADPTAKPDPKKKPAPATGGTATVVPPVAPGWVPVKGANDKPIVSGDYSLVAKPSGNGLAGLRWEVKLDETLITPTKKKDAERLTDPSNRGLPPKPSPQKLTERDDPEPAPATAPLGNVLDKATKDAEEEARGLKNRLDGGHTIMPGEVRIAGRHLVDAARQAGTPIAPDIVKFLGDVVNSLLKKEAERIGSGANRGKGIQPGYLDYLAATGLGAERQSQLFGQGGGSGGLPESVTVVAEIKREQWMKMIDAGERQSPIGEAFAEYLELILLGIGGQDAKRGLDPQEDVIARVKRLADIPRVLIADEAKNLLDRATAERFDESYVDLLRFRLEQKVDGPARKLANDLLEMQRSWFRADRSNVADRTSRGETVPGFYLEYLQVREKQLGLNNKDAESGELKRPAM